MTRRAVARGTYGIVLIGMLAALVLATTPAGAAILCTTDAECDDGDPKTADGCFSSGFCVSGESCTASADCSPNSFGQRDRDCRDGQCVSGPCFSDAGCFGDERCMLREGFCVHGRICTANADCDDGIPLTNDRCIGGRCTYEVACTSDGDCDDRNACTDDLCFFRPDSICVSECARYDDETSWIATTLTGTRCSTDSDCLDTNPATHQEFCADVRGFEECIIQNLCQMDAECRSGPLGLQSIPDARCLGGGCFAPKRCTADPDCDDGLAQSSDRCVDGSCTFSYPATPDICTPTCDDGDERTVDVPVATETFRKSTCVSDVIPCSTTDPCKIPVCDPYRGCIEKPKDCSSYLAPSSDGTSFLRYVECDGTDSAGLCTIPEPCNDDDPCTHDTRDADGQCHHVPKLCDEQGNCTTSDGQWAFRPQCRTPDDRCTVDTCDVDGRCVEFPVFCSPGPCGEPPLCNPISGECWVPLTTDPRECLCDAPRDDCSVAHVATPRIANGVGTYYACDKEVTRTCDEAGSCTCDGVPCPSLCSDREGRAALLASGGCLASSLPVKFEALYGRSQHCRGAQCVTEACNDGDACTEDCGPCEGAYMALFAGSSEGGPFLTCLAAGDFPSFESFEPVCNPAPLDCEDDDPCTDDACAASGCEHTPRRCDDGNACTDDSCNAVGACIHADNTASCDDGIACTENDTCRNGTCSDGRYSWSGLLQPINADGSSVFKRGSTVPVKFRLTDSCAGTLSFPAEIFLAKVSDQVAGSDQEAPSTSAADTGNRFRYDPTGDQYVFQLATKPLSAGAWQIRVQGNLNEPPSTTVLISIRK